MSDDKEPINIDMGSVDAYARALLLHLNTHGEENFAAMEARRAEMDAKIIQVNSPEMKERIRLFQEESARKAIAEYEHRKAIDEECNRKIEEERTRKHIAVLKAMYPWLDASIENASHECGKSCSDGECQGRCSYEANHDKKLPCDCMSHLPKRDEKELSND